MVFVFIVSNTQSWHACTWRLVPLGCFSGRCHTCSTCRVVHCLHHTVVHWCHWTTIQDCQWNPCMMVMLVQHVCMQYCSYNEHSVGQYWYCMVNLFKQLKHTILYFHYSYYITTSLLPLVPTTQCTLQYTRTHQTMWHPYLLQYTVLQQWSYCQQQIKPWLILCMLR